MSIKKKFVTAITTAGLLAGLFGSAFVPSALARGAEAGTPVKALSDWFINTHDNMDDGYDQDGIQSKNDTLSRPTTLHIASHQDSGDNDLSIGFALANADGAVEVADLEATSTGFVEVAWALRERINHSNDNGEGPYDFVECDWDLTDNLFGLSDSVTGAKSDGDQNDSYAGHVGAGEFYLCLRVKDDTKPGKSTITIKANGATLTTFSVTVLGDLASLTLTANRGYTNVAEGNHEIDGFFRVVGKDSAGQVINAEGGRGLGTGRGFFAYLNDYTNESVTEAGDDAGDVIENAQGNTMDFVDNSFDYSQTLDLNADVCNAESYDGAGDGDDGESYDLAIEMLNWAGDVITSNGVEITCTGSTDGAVLSNIVAETATGEADWAASDAGEADSDGVIAIYATVKDASGHLIGLDNTIGFNIDLAADFDTELDLTEWESQVGPGGKIMLGYIVPDMTAEGMVNGTKYSYEVTIADFDFGNTDSTEELAKTLYYTAVSGIELDYSLTRVRNAAKTVATWTADYGVACSSARITFDWENGDGTKYGTVTRRANINGVAKFSMARRNTSIFVYASGCANYSAETDWVKARFR